VLDEVWQRCSPIAVASGRTEGNVGSGHQQEGPEEMYDAAGGQGQEGGLDGDAVFIQDLEERCYEPLLHLQRNPFTLSGSL